MALQSTNSPAIKAAACHDMTPEVRATTSAHIPNSGEFSSITPHYRATGPIRLVTTCWVVPRLPRHGDVAPLRR